MTADYDPRFVVDATQYNDDSIKGVIYFKNIKMFEIK